MKPNNKQSVIDKRYWTNQDKSTVITMLKSGSRIERISLVINRTVQAINKFIRKNNINIDGSKRRISNDVISLKTQNIDTRECIKMPQKLSIFMGRSSYL